MTAVDFGAWVLPALELTVGGRTYMVPPPTVEQSQKIIALAVRAEVQFRIVDGDVPEPVQKVLDSIGPQEHPALGDTYTQMVDDGVLPPVRDRMEFYATFYWVRGKAYADALAELLWTPRDTAAEGGGAAPKARRSSPRKSGRRTASESR